VVTGVKKSGGGAEAVTQEGSTDKAEKNFSLDKEKGRVPQNNQTGCCRG
jgi:hypothetical protein